MNYYAYTFLMPANEKREILLSLLTTLSFESFEEYEDKMIGYLKASDRVEGFEKRMDELSSFVGAFNYDFEIIEPRNWNKEWEANFQPIVIDDFCGIRADFHPPIQGVQYEILLNPEMAFGTGHHETTYMVMKAMQKIDWNQKEVFDFGCGTGILSILASFLGAKHIDAIDIEAAAYENTLVNNKVNQVRNVNVKQGVLEDIDINYQYDYILANINRNVILNSLSTLYKMVKKEGKIIFSGILIKDWDLVEKALLDNGFVIENHDTRGKWSAITVSK